MRRIHFDKRTALLLAAVFTLGAAALLTALKLSDHGFGAGPEPSGLVAAENSTKHPPADRFKVDDLTLKQCDRGELGRHRSIGACHEQALGNLAYRKGPEAAFDVLQERVSGPDSAAWIAEAHLLQHYIGSATLARVGGSTAKAFGVGHRSTTSAGTGGFYHGILMRALRGVSADQLPKKVASICADPAVHATYYLANQCLHGMGHGLMLNTGANLPLALKACDGVSVPHERFWCHTGAFMENLAKFQGVDSGLTSSYVREDDLLYPCNWVATSYKRACYIQATIRIGPAVNWDWSRVGDECRKAEPGFVNACYYSTGLSVWSLGTEPSAVIGRCRALRAGDQVCVSAVAAVVVTDSDASGRETARMCFGMTASYKRSCYEGLGRGMGPLGEGKMHRACNALAGSYAANCLNPPRY